MYLFRPVLFAGPCSSGPISTGSIPPPILNCSPSGCMTTSLMLNNCSFRYVQNIHFYVIADQLMLNFDFQLIFLIIADVTGIFQVSIPKETNLYPHTYPRGLLARPLTISAIQRRFLYCAV